MNGDNHNLTTFVTVIIMAIIPVLQTSNLENYLCVGKDTRHELEDVNFVLQLFN